jgi:hypothetical protein
MALPRTATTKLSIGAVVVGLLALVLNRLLLLAEARFDPLKHVEPS